MSVMIWFDAIYEAVGVRDVERLSRVMKQIGWTMVRPTRLKVTVKVTSHSRWVAVSVLEQVYDALRSTGEG